MRPVYLLAGAALVMVFAVALPTARAHHDTPAPQTQSEVDLPEKSQVRVIFGAASFSLEGHQGSYRTLAFTTSGRVYKKFYLRGRAPLHAAEVDAMERTTGIGDVTVGGFWMSTSRVGDVRLGMDGLLPTGRREDGLGAGSPAVSAWATLARPLAGDVSVRGGLATVANLMRRSETNTTFIEHRSDLETRLVGGLAYAHGRFSVAGDLAAAVPFAPAAARGEVFVSTRGAAAIVVGDFDVELAIELPLGAARRLDWSTQLGLAYRWGTAASN